MARQLTQRIRRSSAVSAVFFWLVQILLGLPSLAQTAHLLATGKAEGALFMIALYLAWIGATIAVATACLIHSDLVMPILQAQLMEAPSRPTTEQMKEGYTEQLNGYAFQRLKGGRIRCLTAEGPMDFAGWEEFKTAVSG
jgi:hypothetical protein